MGAELGRRARPSLVALAVVLFMSACGRGSFEGLMDIGVCDPRAGFFTTEVDNPYFPLPVGHRVVLKGEERGLEVVVRITVLPETETVAGVETLVVEEHESEGGRVAEISRNYFAQTGDGTVCYFGEEVDDFDAQGNIVSHAGAWRAGEDGNRPGIFMPATVRVGQAFQQEVAPGIAEDQSKVVALGESTEVPAGTFTDTATLLDRDVLKGGQDTKVYARGIGLIVDGPARMMSYTP